MPALDKTTVINDWTALLETAKRTRAVGHKGGGFTVTAKSTEVHVTTDPTVLGRGVADAIALALRHQVEAIGAEASAATVGYRARARTALARGDAWAVRRYGSLPPGRVGGGRLFNDSGRIAKSIHAVPGEQPGMFLINVAPNRLDESTFGSGFAAMVERFRLAVPGLSNPAALANAPEVQAALTNAAGRVADKPADLRKKVAEELIGLARAVASLGD